MNKAILIINANMAAVQTIKHDLMSDLPPEFRGKCGSGGVCIVALVKAIVKRVRR